MKKREKKEKEEKTTPTTLISREAVTSVLCNQQGLHHVALGYTLFRKDYTVGLAMGGRLVSTFSDLRKMSRADLERCIALAIDRDVKVLQEPREAELKTRRPAIAASLPKKTAQRSPSGRKAR